MATKGSHCKKGMMRRVPSIYGGTVKRCKGYVGGRRRAKGKSRKRKGRGKKRGPCVAWSTNKLGRVYCASYGGKGSAERRAANKARGKDWYNYHPAPGVSARGYAAGASAFAAKRSAANIAAQVRRNNPNEFRKAPPSGPQPGDWRRGGPAAKQPYVPNIQQGSFPYG
jgi:hypothetical protein